VLISLLRELTDGDAISTSARFSSGR